MSVQPPAQNPPDAHSAQGFPAIANTHSRLLILGSMPGLASLRAGQYYAHPRNQFWPIMAAILGVDLPALTYPQRCQALLDAGIALWDVLYSCHRPGSLDADIAPDSVEVNDFATFFRRHPAIERVYFNGGAAEQLFKRHVQTHVQTHLQPHLQTQRLPSTSPAHAALDFSGKLTHWHRISETLRQAGSA
jgi:hypoxanthine-DNA glycosylase